MTRNLLTDFAAFQKGKGLAPRTIANRAYMLEALVRATDVDLEHITIHDLRAWIGRGISKSSMQTERDTYRAFFRFAREEGYRTDDPSERLAPIRAARGKPRPYSTDQIDALLNSGAYARTRAMILLGCYQGFRAAEIAAIHGHDIDHDADTIRVTGKGGKQSVLPLHPVIRDLSTRMPADGYWFPARKTNDGHIHSRSVSDLMWRAKKRAGIRNQRLTGHSLRHSYGTDLVRAGVDLRTVQELMRHESLATTQIYTLIDDQQLRAGIIRLPAHQIPTRAARKAA
jgi:integrase/recombinase XerD